MQIYKITNTLNNKCYIGKTKKTFYIRYNRRNDWWNAPSVNYALSDAVKKYGPDNFIVEILADNQNLLDTELNELEKQFIKQYNSISPNGYNFTSGGDGGFKYCEESINKLRKTKTGVPAKGKNLKGHKKSREQIERFVEAKRQKFLTGEITPWNKGIKIGKPSEQAILNSAKAHHKSVIRINPINNEIKIYESLISTKNDGFSPSCVSLCCKHPEKHKTHKNFKWSYFKGK